MIPEMDSRSEAWGAHSFEILYHNAMPGWVKLKGLDIRAIPECEGGGFAVRQDQGQLIVTAVNSHAALLAAAKEMLSALATRDIGSFTWDSRASKALQSAITLAEEYAP